MGFNDDLETVVESILDSDELSDEQKADLLDPDDGIISDVFDD